MTTRIPRRMTALLLAGCLSPLMVHAQAIQIQRKAFIDAPALPFAAPAPALVLPVIAATPPSKVEVVAVPVQKIIFELRASDRSLKNAFLRWAEEHRQQVVWRLTGDIPLDANGPVSAISLVDAMTQAAAAFADKQEPFVIREYDNSIVVIPRWAARP